MKKLAKRILLCLLAGLLWVTAMDLVLVLVLALVLVLVLVLELELVLLVFNNLLLPVLQ